MAKTDWGALQHQFLAEHAKTGISPRDWCEAQGLKYSSAKLYIKIANRGANSQKKSANKTANSQKGKRATPKPAPPSREKCETSKAASSPETKPIRGSRTAPPVNPFAPGNQHALKHGGYGRRLLLSDATSEDAQALSLDDELFWLRAANLTAAENIGRWRTMMDDAANEDERQQFMDNISAAEKAMHRNTARIESLELTKASIEHRLASAEKVTLEADRLKREAGDPNNNAPRGLNDFYADIETDTESGAASVLDDESQE